jgi:hypothetical protein
MKDFDKDHGFAPCFHGCVSEVLSLLSFSFNPAKQGVQPSQPSCFEFQLGIVVGNKRTSFSSAVKNQR